MPDSPAPRPNRFVAADLAALARVPANAGALAALAAVAGPQREAEAPPWIVGGFSVGVDPDLVVHFFKIADAVGRQARFVYGRPALIDADDRILAYANNMRDLYLRTDEAGRTAALAHGAQPRLDIGTDWVWVNPWLVARRRAEREALVAGWIGAASDA